jgi:hypothetical protein
VLRAGYVIGAAAMKIAVGVRFFVEPFGIAILQHFGDDALIFGCGTIAVHDAVGLGEPSRVINPVFEWSPHCAPSAKRPACVADASKPWPITSDRL